MQVIEIEPLNEEINEKEKRCRYTERVMFWFVYFLIVLFCSLFCAEVLQLMHFRNKVMQYEFDEHVRVHQNRNPFYKPLPWMP